MYKKKLKNIICTNCGKKNHEYKQCDKPITSWGIILINLNNFNRPLHDEISDYDIMNMDNQNSISMQSIDERMLASLCFTDIQFLMISRKHSLGYIEFVRGRYKPHMIDQTVYLFKQMKQSEIQRITLSQEMEDGFDYLWKDLWGERANCSHLAKERIESKNNYDALRYTGSGGPEINLDFIVKNVKPEYDTDEWGFPKGRRNRTETELECAVREFKEETGYSCEDFKVIENISPIREEFIGTNGIKYRHVYYVAELISQKKPENNTTSYQKNEVGDINFFNFQQSIDIIRDYHVERKNIVKNVFMYYIKKIIADYRKRESNEVILNIDNSFIKKSNETEQLIKPIKILPKNDSLKNLTGIEKQQKYQ